MKPIDFVITWVDSNDRNWQNQKRYYEGIVDDGDESYQGEHRYRDIGIFKYVFRSIERYAPWVNRVYLVTEGHLPEWLNSDHPKLKHIRHDDFIPKHYLPTFNTNAIELNFHRIPGLSEQFVVFNDDMLLNHPVSPSDFYVDGKPKHVAVYRLLPADSFSHIELNNIILINKYFYGKKAMKSSPGKFFTPKYGKMVLRNVWLAPSKLISAYYNMHVTVPMLKSTYNEVWNKEFHVLDKTSRHKFRTVEDVSDWVMSYWDIESNRFEAQSFQFGQLMDVNDIEALHQVMIDQTVKVMCLNDNELIGDMDDVVPKLIDLLNMKYPEKSTYER